MPQFYSISKGTSVTIFTLWEGYLTEVSRIFNVVFPFALSPTVVPDIPVDDVKGEKPTGKDEPQGAEGDQGDASPEGQSGVSQNVREAVLRWFPT